MLGRIKSSVKQRRTQRKSSSVDSMESTGSNGQPSSGRSGASQTTNFVEEPSMLEYLSKMEELANFDACVETADALAASSPYTKSSAKIDESTGLADCTVLVSPDGDLLLLPNSCDGQSQGLSSNPSTGEATGTATEAENEDAPALVESAPSAVSNLLSLEAVGGESAVFMGNDLRPAGDKALNHFSAMGWSPSATSLAIRQSEDALRNMATFVEDLILSRKESAAQACRTCDKLRTTAGMFAGAQREVSAGSTSSSSSGVFRTNRSSGSSGGKRISNDTGELEILHAESGAPLSARSTGSSDTANGSIVDPVPNRVGPLLFPGGTLHAATVALEHYMSITAENDAERMRKASKVPSVLSLNGEHSRYSSTSSSHVGILPEILQAADRASERSYKREKALREMQRRSDDIERRLAQCKEESKRRWDAVHDAEERVTRIVEERMLERSRERERRRLKEMSETLAKEEEKDNAELGATPGEIWDLVSAMAETMEGGSFEPTGLPGAPLLAPHDKSGNSDNKDQNAQAVPTPAEDNVPPRPGTPPFPIASRVEIEHACNLPELRAAAISADEAIEDAAGALLNVLSILDTTRRSARVAAETCLLSVANSQAKCIRSLVALERASIEERLQNIAELERIADNIDVRRDLDAYIMADKKERGGSTWLGDDDDGGVASALAVLSSHVEGSMGLSTGSSMSTVGWDQSDSDEEIATEKVEDAVDCLFASNADLFEATEDSLSAKDKERRKALRDEYETSVELLCKVAADKRSLPNRKHRSTICYAINQKRSSNAELQGPIQFDGLCRVFESILTGCDTEPGGVSNAKMCMMLSQTFYMVEREDGAANDNPVGSPVRSARSKRIFVKTRLMDHPLWTDDEFWDHALYQCVAESLTHSGVMANFERSSRTVNKSEWKESRKIKWHDLTQKERAEAASQVHAVVFAQLGALAHSMEEFGCGIERSSRFVRRMAIRNQLPISQRIMLLQHLMKRDDHSEPAKDER